MGGVRNQPQARTVDALYICPDRFPERNGLPWGRQQPFHPNFSKLRPERRNQPSQQVSLTLLFATANARASMPIDRSTAENEPVRGPAQPERRTHFAESQGFHRAPGKRQEPERDKGLARKASGPRAVGGR